MSERKMEGFGVMHGYKKLWLLHGYIDVCSWQGVPKIA